VFVQRKRKQAHKIVEDMLSMTNRDGDVNTDIDITEKLFKIEKPQLSHEHGRAWRSAL
jgi:hypothetical protein